LGSILNRCASIPRCASFIILAVSSAFAANTIACVQLLSVIDAAHLTSVVDRDAAWSFHAGNDPHWADPGFDDSAWPKMHPGQTFADAGIRKPDGSHSWVRLHLQMDNAAGPLALAVSTSNVDAPYRKPAYEIFANGGKIGETRGWEAGALGNDPPMAFALPQVTEVVVSIHFFSSRHRLTQFPVSSPWCKYRICGMMSVVP
jgi:hypothetical protein